MTLNEWLRAVAGFFVLLSLVLGYTVSYAISKVLLTFLGPVIVFTV